ncbi:hypothetical protein HAX54_013363 [Datura stramonium]|uniref:Uncharacterized protein n=1 Tax=Datura stramonium TaxID=4076 RepID=A0ABS8TN04_DATST|nr:hypothetical protein [Datura stramonium]
MARYTSPSTALKRAMRQSLYCFELPTVWKKVGDRWTTYEHHQIAGAIAEVLKNLLPGVGTNWRSTDQHRRTANASVEEPKTSLSFSIKLLAFREPVLVNNFLITSEARQPE